MIPIECGGCAPPVFVETERQRDQRTADRLRLERRSAADFADTIKRWDRYQAELASRTTGDYSAAIPKEEAAP